MLHADERNSHLSEKLGKDVYHYHLHVVLIPVIEKQVRWSKRCKNPELVGTVKESFLQVSHSKKWASEIVDGKQVKSYSLLQDRYYAHMVAAGFDGFERGERGSTAEHLEVLDFKIKQDKQRADELQDSIAKCEKTERQLEQSIKQKQGELSEVKAKIHTTKTTHEDLEKMASAAPFPHKGKVLLAEKDWAKAKKLAGQGVDAPQIIAKFNEEFLAHKDTKAALKEKQGHLHASDKKVAALKMELQELRPYKVALELLPTHERAQLLRAARVAPQQRVGVVQR